MSQQILDAVAKLKESPAFDEVFSYAKGVAKANKQDTLDIAHIGIGAWIAARHTSFSGGSVLSHHLAQYAAEIEKFTKHRKWLLAEAMPSDDKLELSTGLAEAMVKAAADSDPMLALINASITQAVQVWQLERTAYHEAGHAVATLITRPEVRMSKITIAPSEEARGSVSYHESNVQTPMSREDAIEQICVCLAGRAAQVIKFGGNAADSGATGDMDSATGTAFHAVAILGLDDEFGPISLDVVAQSFNKIVGINAKNGDAGGMQVGRGYLFDEAQRRIQIMLKEGYAMTLEMLRDNWEVLEEITARLLAKETLVESDIADLIPKVKARNA